MENLLSNTPLQCYGKVFLPASRKYQQEMDLRDNIRSI
jgi:hypothetical protein